VVTCLTDASAKDMADPPHDECAATGRIQHSSIVKSSLRKRSAVRKDINLDDLAAGHKPTKREALTLASDDPSAPEATKRSLRRSRKPVRAENSVLSS
jgi:hypothetical protein